MPLRTTHLLNILRVADGSLTNCNICQVAILLPVGNSNILLELNPDNAGWSHFCHGRIGACSLPMSISTLSFSLSSSTLQDGMACKIGLMCDYICWCAVGRLLCSCANLWRSGPPSPSHQPCCHLPGLHSLTAAPLLSVMLLCIIFCHCESLKSLACLQKAHPTS